MSSRYYPEIKQIDIFQKLKQLNLFELDERGHCLAFSILAAYYHSHFTIERFFKLIFEIYQSDKKELLDNFDIIEFGDKISSLQLFPLENNAMMTSLDLSKRTKILAPFTFSFHSSVFKIIGVSGLVNYFSQYEIAARYENQKHITIPPVSFIVLANKHAIYVSYHSLTSRWLLLNPNNMHRNHEYYLHEFAKRLFFQFYELSPSANHSWESASIPFTMIPLSSAAHSPIIEKIHTHVTFLNIQSVYIAKPLSVSKLTSALITDNQEKVNKLVSKLIEYHQHHPSIFFKIPFYQGIMPLFEYDIKHKTQFLDTLLNTISLLHIEGYITLFTQNSTTLSDMRLLKILQLTYQKRSAIPLTYASKIDNLLKHNTLTSSDLIELKKLDFTVLEALLFKKSTPNNPMPHIVFYSLTYSLEENMNILKAIKDNPDNTHLITHLLLLWKIATIENNTDEYIIEVFNLLNLEPALMTLTQLQPIFTSFSMKQKDWLLEHSILSENDMLSSYLINIGASPFRGLQAIDGEDLMIFLYCKPQWLFLISFIQKHNLHFSNRQIHPNIDTIIILTCTACCLIYNEDNINEVHFHFRNYVIFLLSNCSSKDRAHIIEKVTHSVAFSSYQLTQLKMIQAMSTPKPLVDNGVKLFKTNSKEALEKKRKWCDVIQPLSNPDSNPTANLNFFIKKPNNLDSSHQTDCLFS
jgi:hypothetical protein